MSGPRSRRATIRERAAGRYRARRDALVEAAEVPHGSRRRGLVLAAGGLAALASMYQLVSADVLAVNFTTMNSSFQLYTNYLQGEKVAAYLNSTSRQDGINVPVAELGVKKASLSGLCLIANETLPGPLGDYSLVLTAGDTVPATSTFQTAPSITDPNYYLPTGWTAGTDVWGTDGNAANGEYVGALKGTRAANAIKATDLFLNTSALRGSGYKVSGLYLGERAQSVGPQAGVSWESGKGSVSPDDAPTAGGFGLRVEHLNLAGGQLWTDGSAMIPGTPAVPDQPATQDTTVTVSDGPPAIVDLTVNAPDASYANVASDNNYKNQVGRIVDGDLATKWVVSKDNGTTVANTATLTYTLSQPWKVTAYQIGTGNTNDTPPQTWTREGSKNGTDFTTIDSVNNADLSVSQWTSFYVDSPDFYKYYRLRITANKGAPSLQLSEWKLGGIGVVGSSSANPTQDATFVLNNGENYRMLIDGNGGTKFYNQYDEGTYDNPGTSVSNPNFQVVYQLFDSAKVTSYSLKSAADSASFGWRNPQRWTVAGSNDGSTWTALTSANAGNGSDPTSTDQTFSSSNAVNTYTITNAGSYKYYRLTVTKLTGQSFTAYGGFLGLQSKTAYRHALQLADWMLNTGTVQQLVPGTPFVPGTPAGPDTPAIPAGGSAYGLRLVGNISLPKLRIKVVPGKKTQSYCPTAAG